jgi:hypothetical protein
MSTLPLRAPRIPTLPATGFSRAIAAVLVMIDVFSEAQAQARAAHQRYPFADW